MRTSNPALNAQTFAGSRSSSGTNQMTVQGTVNKSGILLMLTMVTAAFTWSKFYASGGNPAAVGPWMIGGALGGFITAMVIVFKRTWAPTAAPIYALLEGFFLGGISSVMEAQFPGIVIQAVGLTFGTAFSLLLLYKANYIQVTENFRTGIMAATGGIALVYLLSFVLGFFGMPIGFIHSSGLMGIGFSLFVVVVAAMNLILDFDFIHKGATMGAPKFMEWYAAFGLMVTLVWLYIEILRLLSKLRDRR